MFLQIFKRNNNNKSFDIIIKAFGLEFLFALLFFSCAKQVPLTGGPKDIEPPKLISAEPAMGALNFNSENIVLKFDEYIILNNLNQKLIISPPINPEPKILLSGKKIKIAFSPNSLLPNTTYLINFNDAIADNNENNALNSFIYAFSTGNIIDSLMISGTVKDAYTKKPATDTWVLLHKNLSDTAILSMQPDYITKTDNEGNFKLLFLKQNHYKIYALKDNNFNFIYDLPNEQIAFIDSVLFPTAEINDSNKIINYSPENIELNLFSSEKMLQNVKSSKRLYKNKLEFIFEKPSKKKAELTIFEDTSALVIFNQSLDTVDVWLTNQELIEKNQIPVAIKYWDEDFNDTVIVDTILLRIAEKNVNYTNINAAVQKVKEPHKDLTIKFNIPISQVDENKFMLMFKSDTTFISTEAKIEFDNQNPLEIKVKSDFMEKTDYKLMINDDFCTNIYNVNNNAQEFEFTTNSSNEYSNLKLIFPDSNNQFIVQLLISDKVVYERITNDNICDFQFLKPNKYSIKVIYDDNKNGKWDSGDYKLNKQPEKVVFLKDMYELRANWYHEINWNLEPKLE